MIKRIFVLVVSLVAAASTAQAGVYSEFEQRIRENVIKPFALDIGGLVGATGFAPVRPLGTLHPSVKIVAAVQNKPDKDNLVLRDSGITTFGIPMAEAAIGLPFNLDLVAHGFKVQNLSILGGGVRWCAFKSGLTTKFIPSIGVSAFGDRIDFSAFEASHLGLNAMATWDLPFVAPYIGVGYDATNLKVQSATTTSGSTIIPNTAVQGLSETATGSRFIAGAELKLVFFTLNGGAMLLHGNQGYFVSTGLQF
ncbi:MAG: hypothetical protein HZB91_07110 [Elusimicrobia bacterium]|nr:hypothetical protein [Elusimicrobiota bacterium]